MSQYYDLELNIMSCLLVKPELMEQVIFEDKHIIKQKKLWKFMKAFYLKHKTFDIMIMVNVCKEKYAMINYIKELVLLDPIYENFNKYQKTLIEMYEQSKKEKWIREKIFECSNELYVGNITIDSFKEKIKEIEQKAEDLFKSE